MIDHVDKIKNLIQILNLSSRMIDDQLSIDNPIKPKAFSNLVDHIREGRFPMLWELDVSSMN